MDNLTFEQAEERLEEIVKILESGECSLDKSIELYDEGLRLSKYCTEQLKNAEQKVKSIEEYIKESQSDD